MAEYIPTQETALVVWFADHARSRVSCSRTATTSSKSSRSARQRGKANSEFEFSRVCGI